MGLILLILLMILLVSAIPRWGWNRNWGYAPSALFGIALVVVLILLILGDIPLNRTVVL
jgi:hypothetical protein